MIYWTGYPGVLNVLFKQMSNRYYFFSLLVLLLISCSSQKKIVDSVVTKTTLSTADQQKFTYFLYEALRQKEELQMDAALETFEMCRSIDSLDATPYFELGKLYLSIGMTPKAVRYLEKAVALQPANWWYNEQLIAVYSNLNQWKKAIVVAEQLKIYFPAKENTYRALAVLYKENKEFEKAITAYNKLEEITGIDEYISIEKFRLYLLCNKTKKAVQEIDKLVNKYPNISRYRVLRGDIFMQQNLPEKAYAIYKKVEQEDPQNGYVYLSLSEYFTAKNRPDEALASILKALQNDQLELDAKMDVLGQYVEKLIQDTARFKETENLFTLLVDRYPLEEKVYGYYALFLQFQRRNMEAIGEMETMLNINPKNEQAWLRLIQLYSTDHKFNELALVSSRAIVQFPTMPIFQYYRGFALSQLTDNQGAISAFSAALELVTPAQLPLKSDISAQLGDLYFKLGDKKSSFAAYEQSLLANPKNLMVMNNFAYYLSLEKEELKKAEKMSAKTVELEPKNSTFLDTYAWILYQEGNYSLAKFYIERALDNLGTKEDAGVLYEHYGDILWMMGEDDAKALEMWNKSINAGNSNDALRLKITNKGWKR